MSTSNDNFPDDATQLKTEPQSSDADQTAAEVTENALESSADPAVAAMTEEQRQTRAATKLSSAFRGFAVRRQRRREEAAATDIQRIARGRATRTQARQLLERRRLLARITYCRVDCLFACLPLICVCLFRGACRSAGECGENQAAAFAQDQGKQTVQQKQVTAVTVI
jgi:hypothetical protein